MKTLLLSRAAAALLLAAVLTQPAFAEVPLTIAHQGRIAVSGANYTGTGLFKFRLYSAAAALNPAQLEVTLSGGAVSSISVTHGGSGYAVPPVITIEAPGGSGVTATATASVAAGRVTSITITKAGSGYTAQPQAEAALPPVPFTSVWANAAVPVLPGQITQPVSPVPLPLDNGLYSVALGDPSLAVMNALPATLSPPPGQRLFLRIWFRSTGAGGSPIYEELLPHQELSPVPFALESRSADSAASLIGAQPSTAGFLVTGGTLDAGAPPAQGIGPRMMWFSGERAFRAGEVTDIALMGQGHWDEPQLGRYSTAFGINPLASGYASFSAGDGTRATGSRAVALGYDTQATGTASFAAGYATLASGSYATALGQASEATHSQAAVIGYQLRTGRSRQAVVGAWNTASTSAMFVVGAGTGDASRRNVFTVDSEGDIDDIRHVYASGVGDFAGEVSADSLDVSGNGVVNGFMVVGGALQVNNSATFTGDTTVRTLTITGGADLAEPFDLADTSLEPGTVVVIDDSKAGRLAQSTRAYYRRVAGIISGAGGIRPGLMLQQEGVNSGGKNVALTGRVYALCDATDAPIEPGDLLTTAETPGHAMRAADHTRSQGAILGKAMSRLESGRGLVLVLVTLQ
jgi:cytoskeletal protein CcmA (bactofilin family)